MAAHHQPRGRPNGPRPARNPQVPQERYDQYVAAAITGILSATPDMDFLLIAKKAHAVATSCVDEANARETHAQAGYTNLY